MFCSYLHFFRSVLVRYSAISSSDSRERHFFSSLLLKQPRFQSYIPSKRWNIIQWLRFQMKEDVCASLPGGRNFSFLKQGMPVVTNESPSKKIHACETSVFFQRQG